jgi:hypothetical protein
MNNYAFLGTVRNQLFIPLLSEQAVGDSLKLTSIAAQVGQSPESGEISLTQYEETAILVRGIGHGDWIYSAVIIEQAGQILTLVVQAVFNQSKDPRDYNLRFPMG